MNDFADSQLEPDRSDRAAQMLAWMLLLTAATLALLTLGSVRSWW